MTNPIHNFTARLPGIVYGGDYNPDQWTRETWLEDAALMRQAGVRLVSVGVFSWSSLEPADGQLDFGWLDEVMDILHDHGISVNLSTPNAAPPPWLATEHPEVLPTNKEGRKIAIGSRAHFCPSSTVYRERSQKIARALAKRYGNHPALAMWHIGNEYHTQCFCDQCGARFRDWLRDRHGSLDALNEHWGTTFWSQRYSDWSQVDLPKPVMGNVNPARELDFKRFSSDLLLGCFREERDIMRAITPDIPVLTNFMRFFTGADYTRWAREEDAVALDIYPNPADAESHITAAFNYDLMRSLKGGQPWLMMEQASSAVSQWPLNLVKKPGRMRLGSFQAIAHGADAVMFFQWRASRYGQEKFHSAMLPHSGTDTRTWQEVVDLGQELTQLEEIAGTTAEAAVAIVWDWENWWAMEGVAHPTKLSYVDIVTRHFTPLWRRNIATDVITLDADMSGYRLIVIPNSYVLSEAQTEQLNAYVRSGGHILISFFSGVVDEHDRVIPGGYPGGLLSLIGGRVREFSPLPSDERVRVDMRGSETDAGLWQDDLVTDGATVLATYTDGYLEGEAAILRHGLGDGVVTYLGTQLSETGMDRMLDTVLADAQVAAVLETPAGVEAVERHGPEGSYLFLLNHGQHSAEITVPPGAAELLSGRVAVVAGDTLTLEPAAVAVLKRDRQPVADSRA